MSIRLTEPNRQVQLLHSDETREYWLGDDRYVYHFERGVCIGYLCSQEIWERTFGPHIMGVAQ